jgi:hypothetical protein
VVAVEARFLFRKPSTGITKLGVCISKVLRFSSRNWNGKGKENDLVKIAHYAELAWTAGGGKTSNKK